VNSLFPELKHYFCRSVVSETSELRIFGRPQKVFISQSAEASEIKHSCAFSCFPASLTQLTFVFVSSCF
jgi:hypothetical protein